VNLDSIAPLTSRLVWTESTGSTNSDLVTAVANSPDDWPEFSVLGTDFQTQGRGRAGREWLAPAGSSIFVSVLLKPSADAVANFGWLPLLAGLAARDAIATAGLGADTSVKWPNDVLVGDLKIAGVLSEYVPAAGAIVVGLGMNLKQTRAELPVETATSLALALGHEVEAEAVLLEYLQNLRSDYAALVASGFDADATGLRQRLLANSSTVGRPVRAILPGDLELLGVARDIDAGGRLVLTADGKETVLAAGDIVHLRHAAAT
jgi:BirA family biotin operon repressor/biotin-[acetyl-CoA-carboxylase] ligase